MLVSVGMVWDLPRMRPLVYIHFLSKLGGKTPYGKEQIHPTEKISNRPKNHKHQD